MSPDVVSTRKVCGAPFRLMFSQADQHGRGGQDCGNRARHPSRLPSMCGASLPCGQRSKPLVRKFRQTFHGSSVNMILLTSSFSSGAPPRLGKPAPKRKHRASTAQGPHLQLLAAPFLKIAPCSRASRAQAPRQHRASRPQRSKAMGHV